MVAIHCMLSIPVETKLGVGVCIIPPLQLQKLRLKLGVGICIIPPLQMQKLRLKLGVHICIILSLQMQKLRLKEVKFPLLKSGSVRMKLRTEALQCLQKISFFGLVFSFVRQTY